MAELLKVTTLNRVTGAATVLLDLNDVTNRYIVRGSFNVHPPDRQTAYGQQSRRYAGANAVGESHNNGGVSFQLAIKGTTADNVIVAAEAVAAIFESTAADLYLEWRPDGATNSTYYEIRGPSTYTLTYEWELFTSSRMMRVDFNVPVGPLARGARQTITVGALTLPATFNATIPGDAPALVDVAMTHSGGSTAPAWALIGWGLDDATYTSVNIMEAESATNLITWTVQSDAAYRGSSGLKFTGVAGGAANFAPGGVPPDPFADDAMVEVWARIQIASTAINAKMVAWMQPSQLIYTPEYGQGGKLIVPPNSGTVFRFVRLGTLPMAASGNVLRIQAVTGASSTGTFGLDYVMTVPARSRALGATGKPNDSSYPDFLRSTTSTARVIYHDLAGTTNGLGDVGLGGSAIEMDPGVNLVAIKYSSTVPDDPTLDASSEQTTHALTACSLLVWPRYYLARGA